MLRRLALALTLCCVIGGALLAQTETIRRGILYAERGSKKLRFDLHLPPGEGPHPAMLVIHGGGWKMGLRSVGDPVVLARALNREGIAAASISFRQAPRYPHPAQIEDVRRAMQYLRHHAAELTIDPQRLGVIGASSGGHLAALLATQDDQALPSSKDPLARESTRAICAVAICAPLVLEPRPDENVSPYALRLLLDFLGVTSLESEKEGMRALRLAKEASPATYVTKDDPPMLLIHGAQDRTVPASQTRRMATLLAAAEVRHEALVLPREGHCGFMFRYDKTWRTKKHLWWEKTRAFLRESLIDIQPAAGRVKVEAH